MEGGIGDYIYLAVIVIASIGMILKKRKKQQEQVQEESFPDMSDIFPKLRGLNNMKLILGRSHTTRG